MEISGLDGNTDAMFLDYDTQVGRWNEHFVTREKNTGMRLPKIQPLMSKCERVKIEVAYEDKHGNKISGGVTLEAEKDKEKTSAQPAPPPPKESSNKKK